MSTEVLSRVTAELEADQKSALEEYKDLVRRVANGGDVSTAEVKEILARSNKSPADFKSAVGRLQFRLRVIKEIAAAEAILAEQPEIEAEIRKHDAAVEEARKQRDIAVAPLFAQLKNCTDQHSTIARLKNDLRSSCNPQIVERIRNLNSQIAQLGRFRARLEHCGPNAKDAASGHSVPSLTAEIEKLVRQQNELAEQQLIP